MLFPKLICEEVVVVSSFAPWTCQMPLATSVIIIVRGGPNVPRDAPLATATVFVRIRNKNHQKYNEL
jgi:hypothetical protein